MRRLVTRLLVVGSVCGVVGLALSPVTALGEVSSPSGEETGSSSPLGGALVTPGSPMEGEEAKAAEEAKLANPNVGAEREASRTKFEGLNSEQAGKVDGETFPKLIEEPAGGSPKLPAGESIVGYPIDNAAQIDLPEGKHGVIESTEPIALETSPGHHEPLALGLSEAGSAFEPKTSVVRVRVPKLLADGVQLASSGVSLTPVDASGSSLGGSEGTVDGATVLYANTQTDSDTVVKPLATGFEEDTLLRSVDSPSQLAFRIGLPSGASLVSAKDGSGAVEVVDEGAVIAVVPAPSARDAEGTVVPVSTSVSRDALTVSVDQNAKAYRYPIEVDPTVIENAGYGAGGEILYGATWGFFTENPSIFKVETVGAERPFTYEDVVSKSVAAGERAFFYYPTQGESKIYETKASTAFEGYSGSKMENILGIENVHSGHPEAEQSWIENYGSVSPLCTEAGCAPGTVSSANDKSEVFYQQDERETNEGGGGTSHLYSATVDIVQEAGPSASFIPVEKWLNNDNIYDLYLNATDPGLGIYSSKWTDPSDPTWYPPEGYVSNCTGVQCEECESTTCGGKPIWGDLQGLPEGEDVIEATTKDMVGLSTSTSTKVKIDNSPPYNLTLTGFPADHGISFGRYVVKVNATDGSGSTPSSGVASIKLAIDGKEVGTPRGSCSPGPCTASGEWVINGEEYAAGRHIFTMTATDVTGNVAKEEFPLTIESSESKGVGPGSVDLTSGAYTLNATDVSIAAPGGGLTVQRSYNSRHLTAGSEGPLGPQWSGLGMGGTQSLAKLPTGSMLLTAANGAQSVFAKEGTQFVSPTGDVNLTLKQAEANVFTLTEQNGTVTTFTLPSGGSGTLFTPHTHEEPGVAGTVKYTYQTVGGITEPTQALAPVSAGVSCTTLVKGCRALTFEYAKETSAKGEDESEWGEYKGRLTRVFFTAWEPSKSEMTTTAVAQYSYDEQGRLRAEWNPAISPVLKTMYGYDSEGHVVALTPPGLQTWAFTYASVPSEPGVSRLLKVAQAPASAVLWNGQALVNVEAPKLSGTAMVGNRMGVSNGVWSNEPVTYEYQWERCSTSRGECVPIAGAINPNYIPVEADVGHTLAAVVTAINGDDTLAAMSAVTTGLVTANGAPVYISSTPGGKPPGFKSPEAIAVSSAGDVWLADTEDDQLVELDESGEYVRRIGSAGTGNAQFSDPKGIAVDSKGDVWVSDTGNDRIQELNSRGEHLLSFGSEGTGNGQFESPAGVAVDSKGTVWVADTANDRIQEFNEKGEYQKQFATKGTLARPSSLTVDSSGNIWVTITLKETGVQEFNEKGEFIQSFGPKGEANGDLAQPRGIVVKEKHVWVADTSNSRIEEFNEKREYEKKFGTKGEGNGQLNTPYDLAIDSKGNVWVADTDNSRIEEFNEKGEYKTQFDNQGPTPGELRWPSGVTIGLNGNAWAVNLNIEEHSTDDMVDGFHENGEFLRRFGTEGSGDDQFSEPGAIASNTKNEDLWIADTDNQRIEKVTEFGEYVSQFGSEGSGNGQFRFPNGIAVDAKGNVWVTDTENHRVQEFNEKGEFLKTFGSKGEGDGQFEGPKGIAIDSKGNVWVADTSNDRIQEFNEKGEFLKAFGTFGEGNGQFNWPAGIAIDSAGNVWVADEGNNRVEEFNEKGEYETKFGSVGEGPGQFEDPEGIAIDSKGNLWVSDTDNNRLQHWQVISKVESAEALPPAPGATVEYGVSLSGSGTPYTMTGAEVEKWGQKDDPSEATAIFPPDEPQATPASDYRRATVFYLDNHGRTVNVASPGGAISTSEYNSTDDVVRTLDSDNRAAALKEGSKSAEVSKLLDSESTYNSEGTELQSTLGPQHTIKLASGAKVEARDHQQYTYEEGAPSEGGPYRLVTKVTEGAQYSGKEEEVRTTTTSYSGQSNLGWKLRKPTSVTTEPSGLKLTHTTLYEASTGNVIETRMPASPGENSAHDTQTIYYTTAANSKYPGCGEHPEWAELPCQTQPAKQPETSGVPNLPVTTVTYNIWDEPLTSTETVGTTKRTKTATYDAAGRLETSAISSTVGTALPTVTDEYSAETGALVKQCSNEGKACTEGKPKTITYVYNTLGELTSYTDADEATTTYEYEGEGSYKGEKELGGRLRRVNDGKGAETLTYNETTGLLKELLNEYGTTKLNFTATYDVEGNMTSEGLPNGMEVKYTHSAAGEVTSQEDLKTTHCTEKCVWFSDAIVPSIHGQWLEQTSTLSHQAYTYDAAGRLTQVQNTPAGKGCTTRVYAYDEDTNRTSLKTYEPGTEGKCATEKGAEEKHTYDTADRLTDTGTRYSEFGNITNLPSSDAGGSELASGFYTDNQLASETQNGQTIGYNLDPDGRTTETVATGKRTETVTNHYAGPGSTPAWTVNTAGETTRNISGISGFAATQSNTEAPVLQLTNLHGDINATAYLSETATSLASTADTSEFGVPTTSLPPKYSWLGADEIPTELPSGVLDMGARSYVPELGRFLQPDPRPGGSANAYTYTFGDPVNTSDPSGEYTLGGPSQALINGTKQMASEAAAEQAAINAAARAAAERKAREAEEAAEAAAGPQYGGGGEEEYEEEYEEEEYENASYHQEEQAEQEESFGPGFVTEVDYSGESHAEDAVRLPFEDEESGGEYHTPGERCGSGTEGTRDAKGAHILDVRQEPCRKHRPGWYRNRHHKQEPEARPEPAPAVCPDGAHPSVDVEGNFYCASDGDQEAEPWKPDETPEEEDGE